MGLVHFKNEDVVTCVATLRHVLKFLGYGLAGNGNMCPPTIMTILTDIFLRCTSTIFVNHIRGLADLHPARVSTPELLFAEAQTHHSKLISKPNGWLWTTKSKSAFIAENPELAAIIHTGDEDNKKPHSPRQVWANTGSEPEKDKKGNVINRTPPKDDITKRKKSDGYWEYWCGKCRGGGRWGNHDDEGHDEWRQQCRERMAARNAKKEDSEDSPPSMKRQPSANLCMPTFNYLRGTDLICDSDQSF